MEIVKSLDLGLVINIDRSFNFTISKLDILILQYKSIPVCANLYNSVLINMYSIELL